LEVVEVDGSRSTLKAPPPLDELSSRPTTSGSRSQLGIVAPTSIY
jgi:hypothetical protein